MSLTLEKIFEAKNRIAPYTTRTPLIRLEKLDEYLTRKRPAANP